MQPITVTTNQPSSPLMRRKAPGTCGEFVQGAIDGRDFLVNCPIDLYSQATVYTSDKPGLHLQNPDQFSKIRDAIALAAQEFDLTFSHEMAIASDIPRGKGMASSTADITAALEAACQLCDISIPAGLFARIITEIEPSDCINFPGIAHVNHLTGDLIESMPAPTDISVIIVDCGGEIDTIGFDRERARGVYRQNQPIIAAALGLLKRGLYDGDPRAVAEAATQSAELSQQIHYKPQFKDLLAKTREVGALGINCAHSGTVLGVLYRTSDKLEASLLACIEKTFGSSVERVGTFNIIGGGCFE